MNVEEATAILGLNKSAIDSDSVLRHYNAKAKHCHPDLASFPGHEHDFKRATEAFELLKRLSNGDGYQPKVPTPKSNLEKAIDEFTYTISIDLSQAHYRMSFWQKIWATDGITFEERDHDYQGDILNHDEYLVICSYEDPSPEIETEICRLYCPITSRLLKRNHSEPHQFYEYVLQPIDKVKLRRDIELYLSFGKTLEESLEHVTFRYCLDSEGTAFCPDTGKRTCWADPQQLTLGQWVVIYCEAAIGTVARGRRIFKNRHLVRNMLRDDKLYANL